MHVVSDDKINIDTAYVVHLHLRGFLSLLTLYNRKHDLVQYVLSAHMDIVVWQVNAVPKQCRLIDWHSLLSMMAAYMAGDKALSP